MSLIPQAYAFDISQYFPPAKSFSSAGALLNVLVRNLLTLAGVVAFIAVIVAGIKVIQSAGDAKAQEQSQGAFTTAVIGLLIILGAYFVLEIAKVMTGFDFLNPTIPVILK